MLIICSCKSNVKDADYNYDFVLEHYKENPQKYKAAKFLIKNLSQYYSIQTKYLTNTGKDYTDFLSTYSGPLKKEEIQRSLGVSQNLKIIYDSLQVTPQFLIKSIDEAFEVYNTKDLKRNSYNFETFLEYVLPYRVGSEELNNWRGYMRKRYTAYLQSFNLKSLSQHRLSLLINAEQNGGSDFALNRISHVTSPSVNQTIKEILKVRIPFSCEDYAIKTLYALRAIGIPAAYEIIPLSGKFNFGHAQTAILNENNNFFPAIQDTVQFKYQIAKMYRRTFSRQANPAQLIEAAGEDINNIPPYFNHSNYIDITKERTDVSNIQIDSISTTIHQKVTYICVYNNGQWRPVEWSVLDPKTRSSNFHDMGRKILYAVAVVDKGILKQVRPPFILDTLGHVISFKALEKSSKINLKILNYDRHKLIKPRMEYILYIWDYSKNTWSSYKQLKTSAPLVVFTDIPENQLYKVEPIGEKIDENVRPFTFKNNEQIWW